MKSVAFDHFPRVVVETNRFWLFNPVLKKRYENRPEERVRLMWVEYILHQTGWKKSRIGFELPVKIHQNKHAVRADLILYDHSMKPAVLIKCKSESVKLKHTAAEQAARYNSEVNASFLALTNGIEDYWFEQTNGGIQPAGPVFDERSSFANANPERNSVYWQQRGFCSSTANSVPGDWLPTALRMFWSCETGGEKQYLDFKKTMLPVPMNQFYKVFDAGPERRLAVSFIGTGSSQNHIVGILFKKGENKGIVSINLDKLLKEKKEPVTIFRDHEVKTASFRNTSPFNFSDFEPDQIRNLPQIIMNFFD